jgi:O-antigen ligase
LLINYMGLRPEAASTRWKIIQPSINAFWKRPIGGAGLNNSSAATEGSLAIVQTNKGSQWQVIVVHNYYLIVLVEVGLVGFLFLFGFLGQTMMTALRYIRAAETEMKILLAGIVSAVGGIMVHNFGDPFGGHAVQTMLWLHAGLVFAVCRQVQAQSVPAVRNTTPITPLRLQPVAVGATGARS